MHLTNVRTSGTSCLKISFPKNAFFWCQYDVIPQDGTTACLFVVASNLNSLIGLLGRLMAMERWRSSGLFHVGSPKKSLRHVRSFAKRMGMDE